MARSCTRINRLAKSLILPALLLGPGPALATVAAATATASAAASAAAAAVRTAPTPEDLRGPDVVIIAGEERTIYEYRQNGHLRMVKIVPDWGKPYYLLPRDQTTGFGDLEKADALLPTWVIVEF